MHIVTNRLWQLIGKLDDLRFRTKVDQGTETITCILDVSSPEPREWRLTHRGHVGEEIEIRQEHWRFSDDWAQSNLHLTLDTCHRNDRLVTPVKYQRGPGYYVQ